jgi:ABC-2 type transport system ATP-binding protein
LSEPAIALDAVVKNYGAVAALRKLTLAVQPGEMFGLIGPDGAGKTTTIRLMCGLLKVDGGTVRVFGRDPVKDHRQATQSIGYLSQRFSLYGDLSIDENIAFFAEIHGLRISDPAIADRRTRLLELTQLVPFRDRLADQLSGGMKQKLALACTLVHEPRIILLDEPTTGVDPVSRREFWKLLSEFLARGLTIIMATPYLDEAERCGRVALLHDGHLLAIDRPATLQQSAGQLLEVSIEGSRPPFELLAALPGVRDVQAFGDRAHVRLDALTLADGTRSIGEALRAAGLRPPAIRAVPASLEDVFIELIGAVRNRQQSTEPVK